jgi:hypothetical protein
VSNFTELPTELAGKRVLGTRATPATNLYEGNAQDRWLADQAERIAGDPWADTSKVLVRNPATGELEQRERVIGADGEPTIGKPIDQPDGDQQTREPGTKPAAADGDDQRIKVGDVDYSAAELREAVANLAEEKLRKAHVPEKPSGYKLELPKDVVLPNGATFKIASLSDPIKGPGLGAAMEWAHKQGFSQSQFSEMLGVYAGAISGEQIMIGNAARAERDAMGVTGPARVEAILQYVKAHYPAALRPVAATLATKAQVEMFEDIIMRRTNGGGSSFSQRGRELDDGKVDDATYNSWNYTQKKEYAERQSARDGK